MKTLILFIAFASIYVASLDGAVIKRQAEKGRRLVRVRGRQREDRQLFVEPLPLAVNPSPLLIPAPVPIPQPIQVVEVRAQPQPIQEIVEVREPVSNYGGPAEEVITEVRATNSYSSPQAEDTQIVEVRQPSVFTVPQTVAVENVARARPIAITRSVYNAPGAHPGNDNWDYNFESENGIKQEAVGEVRSIGDSDVVVMRGSYEYIGSDAQVYTVEWEADENGFRASAPHLPKSVPIPFPEQQAAVDAQIRFAAEEDARNLRTSASELLPSYAAALPSYN